MKLLLVLVLLSYCLLVKGDNFIRLNTFTDSNSRCNQNLVARTTYYPNNYCDVIENQSISCDSSTGLFSTTSWSESNCTGSIVQTSTIPLNKCSNYMGVNTVAACVDTFTVPTSKVYVTLDAPTCEAKESFNSLVVIPTGKCFGTGFGTYSVSCNSTSVTTNVYQYGGGCSGTPSQVNVESYHSGCQQVSNDLTTTFQCL